MLDLIELAGGLLELACSWRFFVSALLALGVIMLVITLVPSREAAMAIAIPVGILGIGGGFYWEVRSGW